MQSSGTTKEEAGAVSRGAVPMVLRGELPGVKDTLVGGEPT